MSSFLESVNTRATTYIDESYKKLCGNQTWHQKPLYIEKVEPFFKKLNKSSADLLRTEMAEILATQENNFTQLNSLSVLAKKPVAILGIAAIIVGIVTALFISFTTGIAIGCAGYALYSLAEKLLEPIASIRKNTDEQLEALCKKAERQTKDKIHKK